MGDLIYYDGNWFNSEEDVQDYLEMRFLEGQADGEYDEIPDPFNER